MEEESSSYNYSIKYNNNFKDEKDSSTTSNDGIAIIGFGLRFPGESNDLDQFWKVLIEKIDAVSDIDPERFHPSIALNEQELNKMGSINDWKRFDPLFFGVPPKEVSKIDPQQRLLAKVTWETLEDAGIDPIKIKVEYKEDMDLLLNKTEFYTTISSDEFYRSLKINTKMEYGPHFQLVTEAKLGKEFILAKITMEKRTSIFDKSIFNPVILDNHTTLLMSKFPEDVFSKGLKVSDIILQTFRRTDQITNDGTILFEIERAKILPLSKRTLKDLPIKYPSNELYSSFWQSKEYPFVEDQKMIDQEFENYEYPQIDSKANIFYPFLVNKFYQLIQERNPQFIDDLINGNQSVLELESKYLKEEKWKYLFRNTITFLKENLDLVQQQSDFKSIELHVKNLAPESYQTLFHYVELVSRTIVRFLRPMILENQEKRIIRILELGSGTGAQSSQILEELTKLMEEYKDSTNNYIPKIEYISNQDHFIEREFVIRNGQIMVENWIKETKPQLSSSFETNHLGFKLDINLDPKLKSFNPELQKDDVLVRIKSFGLNFRDTLYHRGIADIEPVIEFSGDVIKVHESVTKFKVGSMVLSNLSDLISKGELGLFPIKDYPISQVKDAYSFMIERKNIGKIVISDLDDTTLNQTIQDLFGKTIIITGQTGVALETINWIIKYSKEPVNIIVLSQSAIKFELEFIKNKNQYENANGTIIHFRQVDISNIDQVRNAINDIYQVDKKIEPVESIFHFAFALADCLPQDISLQHLEKGHSAKTIGALNLHNLSIEFNWRLKNFILNSSCTVTNGSKYQCSYMSSNSVTNSFSKYRRSLGLPWDLYR
eukprot:gene7768-9562_t